MKILFLQKRPILPANTGGKIRTANILRYLARWHDVTYLCNVQDGEQDALDEMRGWGLRVETIDWRETPRNSLRFVAEAMLNLFSPYPFTVVKDFDKTLRSLAEQLFVNNEFDLLICDFVQMARNVIGLDVPASVLFQHNVEADIYKRHAEHDRGWIRRQYMKLQAQKMSSFEGQAGRYFDKVIAVSEHDRNRFQSEYGWEHVECIDTGVDTDFFQPMPDRENANAIVFVGSLDWLPNEDGLQFFVDHAWPRIFAACPSARLQIVGRRPTSTVSRLAERPGISVHPDVPDVRPFLAEASVVVVPLRIGGGTRLKIFEAMAMDKAVVSTSIGAEGLPVKPNVHLQVADRPDEFADAVLKLLHDETLRLEIGQSAGDFVRTRFSAEVVARQFEDVCIRTVERKRSARDMLVADTAVITSCSSPDSPLDRS